MNDVDKLDHIHCLIQRYISHQNMSDLHVALLFIEQMREKYFTDYIQM